MTVRPSMWLALSVAVALSACSRPPEDVRAFAQMDSKQEPIRCGDLIAANAEETSQTPAYFDDHYRPVVMAAGEFGYAFKQCRREIEADRHARCTSYSAQLRQSLVADERQGFGPTLQYGHLPSEWTLTCSAEIRAAVVGVDDRYELDGNGPNPILSLDREGIAIPLSRIVKISIDSRDSSVGLWRVGIDMTSYETHSLWFTSGGKATAAYRQLQAAWSSVRSVATGTSDNT